MPIVYLFAGLVAGVIISNTEAYKKATKEFSDEELEREIHLQTVKDADIVDVEGYYWCATMKDYHADTRTMKLSNLKCASFTVVNDNTAYKAIVVKDASVKRPILVSNQMYSYVQACLA
jgi:arsenate reductase-like glutaredoxin family protein